VKLAIATILWGKTPDLAHFQAVLSEIKSIGFEGVGFETRFLPAKLLKSPEEIPEVVKSSGLENAGCYSSMKPSDVEWASRSKTPLVWLVVRRQKKISTAIRTLTGFSSRAFKAGVIPALHNHLGTCFETEEEIEQALEKVEGLKLCYDTAHAEAAGIDQREFIRKHREKIALVHLKDLRKKVPKSRVSFTKDFVNVGDGIVDFQKVISALLESKYDHYLMLELDAALGKTPYQLAKEGYDKVQKLLL
jgi:sugar phosphate isomerase/epimerase